MKLIKLNRLSLNPLDLLPFAKFVGFFDKTYLFVYLQLLKYCCRAFRFVHFCEIAAGAAVSTQNAVDGHFHIQFKLDGTTLTPSQK